MTKIPQLALLLVLAIGLGTVPAFAESPLSQWNNGTPIEQIQCIEGKTLMQSPNGKPACLSEKSAERLTDRGYTTVTIVETILSDEHPHVNDDTNDHVDVTPTSTSEIILQPQNNKTITLTNYGIEYAPVIGEGYTMGKYWPKYNMTFPEQTRIGEPFDVTYDYTYIIPDEDTGSYDHPEEQCVVSNCERHDFFIVATDYVDVLTEGVEFVQDNYGWEYVPHRNTTSYHFEPIYDNTKPLQQTFTFVINEPNVDYRYGKIRMSVQSQIQDNIYFHAEPDGIVHLSETLLESIGTAAGQSHERPRDTTPRVAPPQYDEEGYRNPLPRELWGSYADFLKEYYSDQNIEEMLIEAKDRPSWVKAFLDAYPELRQQSFGPVLHWILPFAHGQGSTTYVFGSLVNTNPDGARDNVHTATVCAYDASSGMEEIIINNKHVCIETSESGTFQFHVPTGVDLVLRAFAENDNVVVHKINNGKNHIDSRQQNNIPSTDRFDLGTFDISRQVDSKIPIEHRLFWPLEELTNLYDWYHTHVDYRPSQVKVIYDPSICADIGLDPISKILTLSHSEIADGDSCDDYVHSPITNNDTLAHEYAHFVFYSIYDYLDSDYPDYQLLEQNNGWHSPVHGGHAGTAWVEGWAHFMSLAYSNDPIYQPAYMAGQFNFEIRHNNEQSHVEIANKDFATGHTSEGSVAAALWDIIDTENENGDNQQNRLDDVWDVFYTTHRSEDTVSPVDILEFREDWDEEFSSSLDSIFRLNTIQIPEENDDEGSIVFLENFENGLANWQLTGIDDNWRTLVWNYYNVPDSANDNKIALAEDCDVCTMTLQNSIDLSDLDDATLYFWRNVDRSNDEGEGIIINISNNGGATWDEIFNLVAEEYDDRTWHYESYTLEDDYLTRNFKIQIIGKTDRSNEDNLIDDVKITSFSAPADTIKPVITIPPDLTREAAAPLTILTLDEIGMATATDNQDPNPQITWDPTTLEFPVGNNQIVWFATDHAGNTRHATQDIIITDTTKPVIHNIPNDIIRTIDTIGANIDYDMPTATDLADPDISVIASHESGYKFPLGTTTVTFTATDDSGNIQTGSFNITLHLAIDEEPPMLFIPDDKTFEATGPYTTLTIQQIGIATATDAQGIVNITNDIPESFPLGTTVIQYVAIDSSGNSVTDTQSITIIDTIPPYFTSTPEDITITTNDESGIIINFDYPTATDLVDQDVTITSTHESGSLFEVGITTVTFTGTDDAGLTVTHDLTITVNYESQIIVPDTVQNLQIDFTHNSVTATWDDDFDEYEVRLFKIGNYKPGVTITENSYTGTIFPDTLYRLVVVPDNTENKKAAIEFRSLYDPDHPIQNLQITPTHDSLYLSWDNDAALNYTITVREGQSLVFEETTTFSMITIPDLNFGKRHTVDVMVTDIPSSIQTRHVVTMPADLFVNPVSDGFDDISGWSLAKGVSLITRNAFNNYTLSLHVDEGTGESSALIHGEGFGAYANLVRHVHYSPSFDKSDGPVIVQFDYMVPSSSYRFVNTLYEDRVGWFLGESLPMRNSGTWQTYTKNISEIIYDGPLRIQFGMFEKTRGTAGDQMYIDNFRMIQRVPSSASGASGAFSEAVPFGIITNHNPLEPIEMSANSTRHLSVDTDGSGNALYAIESSTMPQGATSIESSPDGTVIIINSQGVAPGEYGFVLTVTHGEQSQSIEYGIVVS